MTEDELDYLRRLEALRLEVKGDLDQLRREVRENAQRTIGDVASLKGWQPSAQNQLDRLEKRIDTLLFCMLPPAPPENPGRSDTAKEAPPPSAAPPPA